MGRLGRAKEVGGRARRGVYGTHVETEPDDCYVEVVELWAGEGGWALVSRVAQVALVGEHLVTREALGGRDISNLRIEKWESRTYLVLGARVVS